MAYFSRFHFFLFFMQKKTNGLGGWCSDKSLFYVLFFVSFVIIMGLLGS